jgi:hypothetical protein
VCAKILPTSALRLPRMTQKQQQQTTSKSAHRKDGKNAICDNLYRLTNTPTRPATRPAHTSTCTPPATPTSSKTLPHPSTSCTRSQPQRPPLTTLPSPPPRPPRLHPPTLATRMSFPPTARDHRVCPPPSHLQHQETRRISRQKSL